jgi:hypothetical protein
MGLKDKIAETYRSRGPLGLAGAAVRRLFRPIRFRCQALYHRAFRRGTFEAMGESYEYFYHSYNWTWDNERAVEVPVAWRAVRRHPPERILEVGNVLSHYFRVRHDVVDKYERGRGVINEDVVDYRPAKRYDLVVSISTLEHVGWDEEPKDPGKVLVAVERLRSLLAPGGRLVATIPLGYNPGLDRLLEEGRLAFGRQSCLKRVSAGCDWREVPWAEVRGARYNDPYPAASGLVIGLDRRP